MLGSSRSAPDMRKNIRSGTTKPVAAAGPKAAARIGPAITPATGMAVLENP
jgi:hypothetical protein